MVAKRRGGGPVVAARLRMSARAGRPREETAAIREWATAHGLEVSARGRCPVAVLSLVIPTGLRLNIIQQRRGVNGALSPPRFAMKAAA